MAEKMTIFQKIGRVLGPDGVKQVQDSPRYNLGNTELLRTTDKGEYEKTLLQAQQDKYLRNTWRKVETGLVQQSMMTETSRIGSYTDFENMEQYPEIAASLDIMMEESTTLNSKGRMLNVYSESKRVKTIIEDLLFNRLDIHTSLPMFARNLCKYGDNFVYLNMASKKGVISVKQMPNFEMERREGDLYGMININNTDDEQTKLKFVWRGKNLEFNPWQIAHFRLLGDDRKLPYGTSLLEKARRVWKQLVLSEDSMLVYRVTRAPERRVFKIYVGNIDDADVQPYVNEIANRFKRASVIDPQTGQMDLKFNVLANDQDFFIPVRTEDAPNPIDTLPGATNLDQIADIEYLQKKLFTALRVPKTFLGFEEASGEGKNLALQDVRFARTINRIQQSLLQELNKIVIIHLVLLGFSDDLANFTITLNNPSTQAEMLKVEHDQIKVTLYKDAVSDAGNGFAAMSMTRGKREILGWSDDEIKQDILEQRIEKAAAAELANSAAVIKHTGLFDKVDRIYGDMELALKGGGSPEGEGGDDAGGGGGGGLGGSFGGGGLGGDDMDFGDDADGDEVDGEGLGGEEGGLEGDDMADDLEPADDEVEPVEPVSEFANKNTELITERLKAVKKAYEAKKIKYSNKFIDRLVESVDSKTKNKQKDTITSKNTQITETLNSMIADIDNLLAD